MDELVDWPERVLTMQRNWIGRSEGARVVFATDDGERRDPGLHDPARHALRRDLLRARAGAPAGRAAWSAGRPERPAVAEYVAAAARADAAERGDAEDRPKTGVFTGRHVVNPVNGEPIPVWVADYVLMDYGTGAIMAVPAHDERDFEFARAHGLPVRRVIARRGRGRRHAARTRRRTPGPGRLVNSGFLDGLERRRTPSARVDRVARRARPGRGRVGYRLRDWLISRQRYWGAPIPIVHCPACGVVPVPDDQLPVLLPEVDDYAPRGQSPLAAERGVRERDLPAVRRAGPARDGHDGHLRRLVLVLPALHRARTYTAAPFEREVVDYWLPVDQYIGGVEHAILHLLYARFFTKVLNDARPGGRRASRSRASSPRG